jgi:hypothetical protein
MGDPPVARAFVAHTHLHCTPCIHASFTIIGRSRVLPTRMVHAHGSYIRTVWPDHSNAPHCVPVRPVFSLSLLRLSTPSIVARRNRCARDAQTAAGELSPYAYMCACVHVSLLKAAYPPPAPPCTSRSIPPPLLTFPRIPLPRHLHPVYSEEGSRRRLFHRQARHLPSCHGARLQRGLGDA